MEQVARVPLPAGNPVLARHLLGPPGRAGAHGHQLVLGVGFIRRDVHPGAVVQANEADADGHRMIAASRIWPGEPGHRPEGADGRHYLLAGELDAHARGAARPGDERGRVRLVRELELDGKPDGGLAFERTGALPALEPAHPARDGLANLLAGFFEREALRRVAPRA